MCSHVVMSHDSSSSPVLVGEMGEEEGGVGMRREGGDEGGG